MRTILVLFALILVPLSSKANLVYCKWKDDSPRHFRCNGQNYVARKISCTFISVDGAFCHERYSEDANACSGDDDPQTLECNKKFSSLRKEELKTESEPSKAKQGQPTSQVSSNADQSTKVSTKTASPKSQAPEDTEADRCQWKEPGIAYHQCEGETFAFGHLSCKDRGDIPNLFCKATHKNDFDACSDDNDPKTIRCLKALMGMRPKRSTNPAPAAPSGAIQ